MKAVIHREHGNPPDVLELIDEDAPPPDDHEAVVAVEAAPIHLGDLMNIRGTSGFRSPLPAVPGIEGVGRIVEVGAAVSELKRGDRVLFRSSTHIGSSSADRRGTWRERLCLPADILIPAPEGDAIQFANLINPATAYSFIHDVTKPAQGEWLLQNAANSNVGRCLIRLANAYGCKTVNVVRRDSLVDELKELGADAVVLDGPDLADKVAVATGDAEIRFGLDSIAGDAVARIGACLVPGGTVFNLGRASGEPCKMPTALMLQKDIRLHGFFAGRPLRRRSTEDQRKLFADLAELIGDGTLVAKIAGTYPLESFREAVNHAAKDGAARDGKIILIPNA